MSAKQTYLITDLAGKWVAGYRLPVDATTIELTAEEAEYDLRVGTIVPPGQPLPTWPDPVAVEGDDLFTLVRAGGQRDVTVAELVAYLVDRGALANGQLGAINGVISTLRGNADQDHNTLGKLAAIIGALGIAQISGLQTALSEKASSADIEAAVGSLARAIAGRATPADIVSAIQPIAAALASKATPGDIASAIQPVAATLAGKADTAVLQAIAVAILDAVDASKLDRAVPAYADRAAALAAIAPGTMRFAEVGGRFSCFRNRAGVLVEPFVTSTDLDA